MKKGGVARLALPVHYPAQPRKAAEQRALGAASCNCALAPEVPMLRSIRAQVAEARTLLE